MRNKSPSAYLASKGIRPPGLFPRARARAINWTPEVKPTTFVVPIKSKPAS